MCTTSGAEKKRSISTGERPGTEVTTLMRFKDSPDPAMISPGSENNVMHSSFRVGDAIMLASDDARRRRTSRVIVPNEAAAVCRAFRWRAGADAAGRNVLFAAL
jgi:uncharacterized glyoxalase superfamily protein PhnB